VSDRRKNTPKAGVESKSNDLGSLRKELLTSAERTIEDRFRDWAFDLVTHERWGRAWRDLNAGQFREDLKWREERLLAIVREFAGDYASLLEKAVVECVRELGTAIGRFKIAVSAADRQELVARALQFALQFTTGTYDRPWGGFFVLPSADSPEMPDARTQSVDFQRANVLARLFQEAQDRANQETVAAIFLREIEAGKWKDRGVRRANDELLLATAGVQPGHSRKTARLAKLSIREEKIWEVIQRGAGGRQYCRELDNAQIAPVRKGVWREGPRKYVAAYDMGQPWRHRIEDEKSKIRRKARAAKLSGTLASE